MDREHLRLVEPEPALESEFLAVAEEYKALGDGRYTPAAADFAAYLAKLARESRGEGLAPGRVPSTALWLVRDDPSGTRLLGISNLRHRVNEALLNEGGHIGYNIRPSERRKGYGTLILSLALEKAKRRGLERVLVTCDTDNIASGKIIRKNGGQFESEVISHYSAKPVSRYWIDLGS